MPIARLSVATSVQLRRNHVLAAVLVIAAILIAVVFAPHRTPVGDAPATESTPQPSATVAPTATPQAQEAVSTQPQVPQIGTLKDIFASQNDNDPRLDTDFKNMTPELKHQLMTLYSQYDKEKFNERGTIVFLIGRDMKTADDAQFLFSVLREPPCKGLAVCGRADQGGEERPGAEVTRAYPQLNALRALVKAQPLVKSFGLERQFNELKDTLKSSESDVLARTANQN